MCHSLFHNLLLNISRTTLGGQEAFSRHPFIAVHKLFPLLDSFSAWLGRMEPSELKVISFEAKQELAHSVGVQGAMNSRYIPAILQNQTMTFASDDIDEEVLLEHFKVLSRQLVTLVAALNKEFQPM